MSKPVRLAKVEEEDNNQFYNFYIGVTNRAEAWVLTHATLCLIILLCMLISLIVTCMLLMVGVSATESGMMRNFINGGLL
jgi:hypothetical protein